MDKKELIKGKADLKQKINSLIVESDLTFEGVVDVLNRLIAVYVEKGNNFLKATNIQEVIPEEPTL